MINSDLKRLLLAHEAKRWIGVKEQGGSNKGQLVQIWQRSVDQKDQSEPWCMAFVQSCIMAVDKLCMEVFVDTNFARVFKSEHVLTTWNQTPAQYRFKEPQVGYIAVWQQNQSIYGHTGIVVRVHGNGVFETVEGNTNDGSGITREGDGVYLRNRIVNPAGIMKLVGFLSVWDVQQSFKQTVP